MTPFMTVKIGYTDYCTGYGGITISFAGSFTVYTFAGWLVSMWPVLALTSLLVLSSLWYPKECLVLPLLSCTLP